MACPGGGRAVHVALREPRPISRRPSVPHISSVLLALGIPT